jgi:hypothetical protein
MPIPQRLLVSLMPVFALGAWLAVALLFTTVSPVGNATAQLAGALLLGAAVGLTTLPVLARLGSRPASGTPVGDLSRAARRASLVAFSVTVLVLLRALDAFSLPLAVFVIVLAVLVEAAFTLRR